MLQATLLLLSLPLVLAAAQVGLLHYAYRISGGLRKNHRTFTLLRAGWTVLLGIPALVLMRDALGGLPPFPIEWMVTAGLLLLLVREASALVLFRYTEKQNKLFVVALGVLGAMLLASWSLYEPQPSPWGFPLQLYVSWVVGLLAGGTWLHRMRRNKVRDAFEPRSSASSTTTA
jgi:hypothetical protein